MTPGVLFGARVAITRPLDQAKELAAALRERGADVVICPLLKITPTRFDVDPSEFDWIIFTSVNGVELFMSAVATPVRVPVACVGAVTAARARELGLDVRAVPERFVGDAVATALRAVTSLQGKNVLLARAAHSENNLVELLRAEGARVRDLEVYRTTADEEGAEKLKREISDSAVDIITFTSSSTVRYYAQYVGATGRAAVAVIGPVTAQTAIELGIEVAVEAEPHTTHGLVDAIEKLWGSK